MRARVALGLLLVLAPLLAPAKGVARIYDPAGDCVLRSGIDAFEPAQRRASWQVLGTRRTRDLAEESDSIIRREGIWTTYSEELGAPLHDRSPGGRLLPFQIFVTDEIPAELAGYTLPYCEDPPAETILINPALGRRELANTLAHELLHAFASGASNGRVDGWWDEATATWASIQFVPHEALISDLDEQFLQRPLVPLDKELADTAFDERPYGAWRLVQWLEGYVGSGRSMYRFMAATYDRMEAGTDGTHALLGELADRGFDLGELLGSFWGEHLRPSSPVSGPATRGEQVSVPSDESAGTELTETRELVAKQIAADVLRFRLPRDSHVQRISFSAESAPPGTYLWVQNGSSLEDWTLGGSASFCVGGFSRTTGARAWAGQFPIAFTNGNVTPGPITHQITIEVSADECEGFVRDPTAAVDDSPVLSLPDTCPAAPRDYPPPAPHTDYHVFREQITRVFDSQVTWQHAAVARIEARDLTQRAAGRLLARWLYCSARRARGLEIPEADGGTDRRLLRTRRRYVNLIRDAAALYERGRFGEPIKYLSDAGIAFAKMVARAQAQDIAQMNE